MRAARNIPLALALIAALGVPLAGDASSQQRASFTVTLNGEPQDDTVIVLRGDDVLVLRSYLQEIHIDAADESVEVIAKQTYVSLRSRAPTLSFDLDNGSYTLHLHTDVRALPVTQRDFAPRPTDQAATAESSGFLNYSLNESLPQHFSLASFEAGATLRRGFLDSTATIENGLFRRGISSYTFDNPARLTTVAFGDSVGEGGSLGGQTIVGGVGFSRSFDLQPSILRSPTAGISGIALAPAQADIYVNGSYYRTVDVPPGQFNFSNIAVPAGGGVTQVILHDTSGHVSSFSAPFYVTSTILAKGTSDYSYHLGFARDNPFGLRDVYGPLTTLNRYRIGLTDALTVGASFEASQGIRNAGASFDLKTRFGEISAEHDLSGYAKQGGNASSLGYTFGGRGLYLGANVTDRSASYATTSLPASADRRTFEASQFLSVPLFKQVAFSLAHTLVHDRDSTPSDQLTAIGTMTLRSGAALSITAQRLRGFTNSLNIFALMSIALSRATTVITSAQHVPGQSSSSVTVQKSIPGTTGLSYSEQLTLGDIRANAASATYATNVGQLQATLSSGNRQPSTQTFTYSGGIAAFRSGIYFTRQLQGGYALVTVGGPPGAEVYVENRPTATTNRHGVAIISDLAPYSANLISISAADAPLDSAADEYEKLIVPRGRVGLSAAFNIRKLQLFTGRVNLLSNGQVRPTTYGRLNLIGGGDSFASEVGKNGEFYFENLHPGKYRAILLSDAGRCIFDLNVPTTHQFIVKLGSLSCSHLTSQQ